MAAELGSIIPVYKQSMSIFMEFLLMGGCGGGVIGTLIGKAFYKSEARVHIEKITSFASWSGFAIGALGMATVLLLH